MVEQFATNQQSLETELSALLRSFPFRYTAFPMQRRHHYERAFEEYLRSRRIPYVSVNEARKALLPVHSSDPSLAALKSFDFVVYGDGANLLVDIKGRQLPARKNKSKLAIGRLETWVTEDDIASLMHWQRLFGPGFEPVFIFIYQCQLQPPDALFQEVLQVRDQWYILRSVRLEDYARHMKPRSPRWRTVHVPAAAFERISQPFAPPGPASGSPGADFGPDVPALLPLTAPLGSSR